MVTAAPAPVRVALCLPVRAPPHPEGDARTRPTPADNLLGGCGRARGVWHERGTAHDASTTPRDDDADDDAVSSPTRQDPGRAALVQAVRAAPRRIRSTATTDRTQGRAARPTDPSARASPRPLRPAGAPCPSGPRRPRRRGPASGRAAAAPASGPTARRPRSPGTRERRGRSWENGTFTRRVRLIRMVLILAMLLVVARLIDVQVLHSSSYQAAAQASPPSPSRVPSLRGGIYDRDGCAAGPLRPHR